MKKNILRIIATIVIAVFCFSAVTNAYFEDGFEVYDSETDYMAEMKIAAEDGSKEAMRYGRFCELCRNLKIRDQELSFEETNFFDGRTAEEVLCDIENYIAKQILVYVGRFYITGYDICVACCGKTDGITYSGTRATVGRTCGASFKWPIGTVFYIDGIGYRTVEDRGLLTSDYHIDVLCNNHEECGAITEYYDVWKVGA